MKSRDAPKHFHRLLAARGQQLSTLSVREGIEAMLEFYRSERATDCALENDGDMLLFQWGTYGSSKFELDITRQFIQPSGEDDDIWQLSLTFFFPPNDLTVGHRWCHSPDELEGFASFVRTHDAYAASAAASPIRVELDFEVAG